MVSRFIEYGAKPDAQGCIMCGLASTSFYAE